MPDQMTDMVRTATDDWKRRYHVERERGRILEGEKRELLDSLAHSAVENTEQKQLIEQIEKKRRIARSALVELHERARHAHMDHYPKHAHELGGVLPVPTCKTCGDLKWLYRQIERTNEEA